MAVCQLMMFRCIKCSISSPVSSETMTKGRRVGTNTETLGSAFFFILWHHLLQEALSAETDLQSWTSSIISLEIHAWLTETTIIQINPSWFYVLENAIPPPPKATLMTIEAHSHFIKTEEGERSFLFLTNIKGFCPLVRAEKSMNPGSPGFPVRRLSSKSILFLPSGSSWLVAPAGPWCLEPSSGNHCRWDTLTSRTENNNMEREGEKREIGLFRLKVQQL